MRNTVLAVAPASIATRKLRSPALAAVLAAGALACALPAMAEPSDVAGIWTDPVKQSKSEIYACDGGICVKVVSPSKGSEKDDFNPDPALKGRPMAGAVIMNGAKPEGANKWKGKLYNPEDGKEYSGSIELVSKDEVKLQGCVMGGLICKTRSWQRAK